MIFTFLDISGWSSAIVISFTLKIKNQIIYLFWVHFWHSHWSSQSRRCTNWSDMTVWSSFMNFPKYHLCRQEWMLFASPWQLKQIYTSGTWKALFCLCNRTMRPPLKLFMKKYISCKTAAQVGSKLWKKFFELINAIVERILFQFSF